MNGLESGIFFMMLYYLIKGIIDHNVLICIVLFGGVYYFGLYICNCVIDGLKYDFLSFKIVIFMGPNVNCKHVTNYY